MINESLRRNRGRLSAFTSRLFATHHPDGVIGMGVEGMTAKQVGERVVGDTEAPGTFNVSHLESRNSGSFSATHNHSEGTHLLGNKRAARGSGEAIRIPSMYVRKNLQSPFILSN